MRIKQLSCGSCMGTGKVRNWVMVSDNEYDVQESVCVLCGGKGYEEYAIFSVEEAEAILKHCCTNNKE